MNFFPKKVFHSYYKFRMVFHYYKLFILKKQIYCHKLHTFNCKNLFQIKKKCIFSRI